MGEHTYFDPEVECGVPTYPFEITAFTFMLYDNSGTGTADVDIVVYNISPTGLICDGPGAELCRVQVTVTEFYPNTVTHNFSAPCCVNGPFFIGIESTSDPIPSFLLDDNPTPDTCENWFLDSDGSFYEWYDVFSELVPGYPLFWVDGETSSAVCIQLCPWNSGDPHKMHFPQLPDEAGWDVNATQPMVLADDFMCIQSGLITDIHFWGSWKWGNLGQVNSFFLSIHEDIPADPPSIPYSRPGATLWEREVTEYSVTPKDPPSMEGWYEPSFGEVIWNHIQAYFQYDICFDPADPDLFHQDSGVIYWLSISAVVADPQMTQWGWKSTQDHWNDDAVWAYWGELSWIDMWEPSPPISNDFGLVMDPSGNFLDGYGENAWGEIWHYYPSLDRWNVWFYDHPFDPERRKFGSIEFDITPYDPGNNWLEIAINWSTDQWYYDYPNDSAPPLPGVSEDLYIGREIIVQANNVNGHYEGIVYELPVRYNPEWVSIDVSGFNIHMLTGILEHECRGSLDLAFVITGEPIVEDSGACCYNPTGGPPSQCIYTTQTHCEQILGGVYQGTGVVCLGVEACCKTNGTCLMIDALCCANELGGIPQGPGTACGSVQACCFSNGPCQDMDSICCVALGGTPQGPTEFCSYYNEACCLPDGTCQDIELICCVNLGGIPYPSSWCGALEACCLPDGTCQDLDPLCCVDLGGTPQGPGSQCTAPEACCLSNGDCVMADPLCCLNELGGYPSGEPWACCIGDFGSGDAVCLDVDLLCCLQMGGDPMPGTSCSPDEACCFPDQRGCRMMSPLCCIFMGGTPQGPGSQCALEACCFPNGSCRVTDPLCCIAQGGTPQGAGTFCGQVMACCMSDGSCQMLDSLCCDELGGVPQGTGTQCTTPEACCFPDHTCQMVDPLCCVEMGGEPQGIGTTCATVTCEEICDCIPGDANNDGELNVGDAVYLISYVFKGGPPPAPYPICSGDANCDCTVNVGDAVYIISYVFKGGPPPCTCEEWLAECGPPLRK
jgi:hypothetical protein